METLILEKQGESITFFGEADSGAPMVRGEVRMEPGAAGPPAHIHTRQRETFHIAAGSMRATLEGKVTVVGAGETLIVEAGQVHTFANASEVEPLVIHSTVEPALHFQWFLQEMARSAIRNGGSWQDLPFLEAAHMLYLMRDEYRLADLPAGLQRVAFGVLSRLARLLGRTREIAPWQTVEAAGSSRVRLG
jgi:quercetin dioxygenase-like cupin family protein